MTQARQHEGQGLPSGTQAQGEAQGRIFRRNPKILYIHGIINNEAMATPDWVMKYFAATGLFPPSSIADVNIFEKRGKKIIRVWMFKEEDALVVIKNKFKLRYLDQFRNVFVDIQRSYEERLELFNKRTHARTQGAQMWTGSNAIPIGSPPYHELVSSDPMHNPSNPYPQRTLNYQRPARMN